MMPNRPGDRRFAAPDRDLWLSPDTVVGDVAAQTRDGGVARTLVNPVKR